MDNYRSLSELLSASPKSRELFSRFSMDAQIALQQQRQTIHSYSDLEKLASVFKDNL